MALLTNLKHYWEMTEASGDREDSAAGGTSLSQIGTVGSTSVSPLGTVADFSATATNRLQILGSHPCTGDSGTYSLWIRWSSSAADSVYKMALIDGGDEAVFYIRGYGSGGTFALYVSLKDSGGDKNNGYSTALSRDTWYHVLLTYTPTLATYYLNGSNSGWTANTKVLSSTILRGDTNPLLRLGLSQNINNDYAWYGQIAKVGFWDAVLSAQDIATLYGSGTPPSYPFGEGARNPVPMGFVLS